MRGILLFELLENCPICHDKMVKGYVQTLSSAIFWSKRKEKLRVHLDAEAIAGSRANILVANVDAVRCLECNIVVFSCDKKYTSYAIELSHYDKLLRHYSIYRTNPRTLLESEIKSLMIAGMKREEAIRQLAIKERIVEGE